MDKCWHCREDGVVWNTNGVGKCRGFRMTDVLIVHHGGSKNDTLCTREVKEG